MALDILSVPAMSAEPERVFSSARITITDRRASLGIETVEAIECLKSWLRKDNISWVDTEVGSWVELRIVTIEPHFCLIGLAWQYGSMYGRITTVSSYHRIRTTRKLVVPYTYGEPQFRRITAVSHYWQHWCTLSTGDGYQLSFMELELPHNDSCSKDYHYQLIAD